MKDGWGKICELHNQYHNESEEVVQKVFEQVFNELFGYSFLNGEIDNHRVLHIGSTDRVIPDIIIRDSQSGKDLFVVELKRLNMCKTDNYVGQLLSYLRLLSLKAGVLICDAVYIYYLSGDETLSVKIPVFESEENGETFMELFKKGNFSNEKIENFISQKNRFNKNVEKIEQELKTLNIKDVLKLYFSGSYDEKEIDAALKNYEVSLRNKTFSLPANNAPTINNIKPAVLEFSSGQEKIQDWVKRILNYLLSHNILKEDEIFYLHDKEYSKKNFDIAFALFVDDYENTIISRHPRYYSDRIGGYYVCSQWWKDKFGIYERDIKRWLSKVCPDYVDRGLDRRR